MNSYKNDNIHQQRKINEKQKVEKRDNKRKKLWVDQWTT